MKNRDGLVSVLFILLLASICFGVKMWSDNGKLKKFVNPQTIMYDDSTYLFINASVCQGTWSKPLTKDELKALDLKLRQEAITFREGNRVVNLLNMQTAVVLDGGTQLRGRGYQNCLIGYDNEGSTETVSAFNLIKIGEDYVEPVLHLKPIQSSYHRFSGEPSRGNGTVEYFYSNGRYRNQVEEP